MMDPILLALCKVVLQDRLLMAEHIINCF